MEGLVSLLPEPYWSRVIALGAAFAPVFGASAPTEPHISYHLAYHYDDDALAAVATFAAATPPLTVIASGLGLFGGTVLTLFINVVRSPQLSRLHQSLCDVVEPLVAEPHAANRYYRPDAWTPHITLGEVSDPASIGQVIAALAPRDFTWQIPLDAVALLTSRALPERQLGRWALGGMPR